MKKGIISCVCHSPEHDLVWTLQDDKDSPPSLYLQVYLGYNFEIPKLIYEMNNRFIMNVAISTYNFFKRIKIATLYVMGKRSDQGNFYTFEITDINYHKADKLIGLLEEFQDRNNIWIQKEKDEEQ